MLERAWKLGQSPRATVRGDDAWYMDRSTGEDEGRRLAQSFELGQAGAVVDGKPLARDVGRMEDDAGRSEVGSRLRVCKKVTDGYQ